MSPLAPLAMGSSVGHVGSHTVRIPYVFKLYSRNHEPAMATSPDCYPMGNENELIGVMSGWYGGFDEGWFYSRRALVPSHSTSQVVPAPCLPHE